MSTSRGFTLIELLLVMAIIGLLASIVLSSLQTARYKAADATVRAEVAQLRTIMEQERSDTGSYAAIKSGGGGTGPGGWITSTGSCGTFTGQYAAQAAQVCKKLLEAATMGKSCGSSCLYFQSTSPSSPTAFSIMAYLPGASKASFDNGDSPYTSYICLGSSGGQTVQINNSPWNEPGCQANP